MPLAIRKYELMVILDPNRTEDQHKEALLKLQQVIEKFGGKHDRTDILGKRRMSYQIKKRRDGVYVVIVFDAEPTGKVLPELELAAKYADDVLRHLVTVAVVGRSLGRPELAQTDERLQRPQGRPSRPRRDEAPAPVAAAPVAEAAPAEAPAAP